jgi:hypothetical protein
MEEVFESPCENLENFVKLLEFYNFGVNGETKGLCCLMGFCLNVGFEYAVEGIHLPLEES